MLFDMTKFDTLLRNICLGLLLIITLLLLIGDRTEPRVVQFSLENKTVSAKTSQLTFTFNREMDKKSVESGFLLSPMIDGTFSWSGRKVAYTFTKPPEYKTHYAISLKKATDKDGKTLTDYESHFDSRSPILSYIGTEGDEYRKIILHDSETNTHEILPTGDLRVLQIFPHPSGRYILFYAIEKNIPETTSLEEYQELYSINIESKEIKKLADNKGFRNSTLSISPDGSLLFIRREEVDEKRLVARSDRLWFSSFPEPNWQPFWYESGNPPVHFTPDGRSVLVWNIREGFMLLPTSQGDRAPEQIGNFERSFGFSSDGTKALFTEFETEGTTRNLNHIIVFYNKGEKTPLLKETGSIISPTFTKDGRFFYYLLMKKEDNTLGAPLFHMYAYDFDKNAVRPITTDPAYSEEQFSISPDESTVVFERFPYYSSDNLGADQRPLVEAVKKSFAGAELWSYKTNTMGELKNLGIKGRDPIWIE